MSHIIKILLICLVIITCCGCSIPKNMAESVLGNYMGGLDSNRINGIKQIFTYDIETCFEKVLTFLKSKAIDATILKINKRNYAVLALISRSTLEEVDSVFKPESADVGIFLVKTGPQATSVEVKSLSSATADYTAVKLFTELQK